MKRAQQMDAVKNQKFYFRTNITATCKEDSEPIIKGIGANKLKCSRGFQGVPREFQGSSRRFPGDFQEVVCKKRWGVFNNKVVNSKIAARAKC